MAATDASKHTSYVMCSQVTLYAMMCSDRRQEVEAGILLYLKELAMQPVPADYANKRGLSGLTSTFIFISGVVYHWKDN